MNTNITFFRDKQSAFKKIFTFSTNIMCRFDLIDTYP